MADLNKIFSDLDRYELEDIIVGLCSDGGYELHRHKDPGTGEEVIYAWHDRKGSFTVATIYED